MAHMAILITRCMLISALAAAALTCGPAAQAAAAGASTAPAPQEESGAPSLSDAASYVRMPALQTPVQADLRMRGMLQVSLALDAPAARTRTLIGQRRLWLRDAYNETLILYASRLYRWGDVPDVDLISELLQEDTDRLLGPDAARIVLSTVIIHTN